MTVTTNATTTQTTHAVFTAMEHHLARHMYKRGANKGDAPLDGSRRGRTHERVCYDRFDDVMYVQFHRTRIFSVTRNGILTINTSGYYDSPTTRVAIRDCNKFMRGMCRIDIGSEAVNSLRSTALYTGGKAYPYRDGMQIDLNTGAVTYPGETTTPTFLGRRKNKAQTAVLRACMKECGFDAMFPMLYDTAVNELKAGKATNMHYDSKYAYHNGLDRIAGWSRSSQVDYVIDAISTENGAGAWLEVVSAAIMPSGGYNVENPEIRTKAETRSAIMAFATAKMYETFDTGISCK